VKLGIEYLAREPMKAYEEQKVEKERKPPRRRRSRIGSDESATLWKPEWDSLP